MEMGRAAVAAGGLLCIIAGLYGLWYGLSHLLAEIAAGNLAGVVGWAVIGYFGGGLGIVILFGVGVLLIVVAVD